MTRLLDRYRRVLAYLLPRAVVWALALGALALLGTGWTVAGAAIAGATVLLLAAWRVARPGADSHVVARAALAMGLAASSTDPVPALLAGLAVVAGLMAEHSIGRATRPGLVAVGLPGYKAPVVTRLREPIFLATVAGVATLALGGMGVPAAAVAVMVLVELGVATALACVQLVRARRHTDEREIRSALTALGPRYGVYYSGTPAGSYQIEMWLPHLRRTGETGVLLIRDDQFVQAAARCGLPVVLARSVESLEYAVVPSLSTLFYVNNDARNVDGVRQRGVTHVHLGHGDSDKPASYSPTFAMFDRIFVAGQAAVDRFAQHGVVVPREKFQLVGRPQVAEIAVAATNIARAGAPVVLYAPTWRGGMGDSVFGSLHWGHRIVAELIAAGAVVWFRPHPYSARDAESRVQIARIDELLAADTSRFHQPSSRLAGRSIFECMNASDALVADISSVASDYLYSNKPFALTDAGLVEDLEAAYPLARAAVTLRRGDELGGPIADLLTGDPRREQRAEIRRYYLGDWPPEEYAHVFVTAAQAVIRAPAPGTRTPGSD